MITDYHAHILPEMDDGASGVQESLSMLSIAAEEGVERQILTPHFHAHNEESVATFLQKRQRAYEKIQNQTSVKEIRLGAEVSLELDAHQIPDLGKLAIEGTRLLLVEPPYYGYTDTLTRDVEQIAWECGVKPMIAHLHRYARFYTKIQMERIFALDAVFQVNTDAFFDHKERRLVWSLIKAGREIALGTDCHNVTLRAPNYSKFQKYLRKNPEFLPLSDEIFEKYKK